MEHFYKTVSGWAAFEDLYRQVVRDAPTHAMSHYVEVGSWFGRSACLMAVEIINSGKTIKFDCVDPWTDGGPDLRNKRSFQNDELYKTFLKNIGPVKHFINPIRKPSLEAAPLYKDGSLDFIMIDGSHQYDDVKADIQAWLPKMKPGAIMSGDDWNWSGVHDAATEIFGMEKIKVHLSERHVRKGNPNKCRYWSVQV